MIATPLKAIFLIIVLVGFINLIAIFIPDQITESINESIIYFLSFVNYLSPLVDVDVVFNCIQILSNFIFSTLLFFMFHWFVRLFINI